MISKTPHAALGLRIGHACIAEVAADGVHAEDLLHIGDLLEDLLRCAPRHELGEIRSRAIQAVAADVFIHVTIELVALVSAELAARHLVVLHRRVVVGPDPLHGHFFRAYGILVDEIETTTERRRWLTMVGL